MEQWGSEIRTSLNIEWAKEVGLQMDLISNGIWNLEAQPFESWQIAAILSKNIWNLDKNFRILNGRDYSYSLS